MLEDRSCHTEGLKQTEGTDQEERYKTQQRPAPGKKKLISAMQAGDTMAAVQLCGKGFGGFG